MRWKRIAPVAFRLVDEIKYKLTEAEKRGDYAEGIELLGGFPLADYPFEDCTASASECEQYRQHDIEQFKARGDRKPDIIFFVIETFRGWTGDIRVPATCEKLPNICKLAKSGLYFPNAHSVGYPSIEGFLGVLAGVWAHPQTTFLSDYPNTRMRALPEILGEAGYYRMVLTATEPSFDNLHPWFAKWFDYSEYKHVSNGDDRFCLMPILDAAKSIEHLEAAYYRYRILPDSITHSENYRGYYSSRTVFERIAEYSVKWNFTDKERTMVKSMFANQFVDYAVKCANNPKVNYKTFSAFINDILEDEKKNPIFSDGKIMYMSKVYRRYYKLMMKRHFYRLYQCIKMITKISKMKSKKQRR